MKLSLFVNFTILTICGLLTPADELKAQWNSPYDSKGNVKPVSEWGGKKQPVIKKEQDRTKTNNAIIKASPTSTTNVLTPNFSTNIQSSQTSGKAEVFYYETISNPLKTTNFIIGIYPYMYSFDATLNNNEGASVIKMGIINHADIDYSWQDYRIIIQLSTGETYTNYTTSSTEGKYSCNYIIPAKGTHHQFLAFHKQFDYKKITKVFVIIGSTIFDLQSGS